MELKPLHDRIVVKPDAPVTKSTGGIILAGQSVDKPSEGTVTAVGNGRILESGIIPLEVKPGDRIIYGKQSGVEVTVDNVKYLIMREDDIMSILV